MTRQRSCAAACRSQAVPDGPDLELSREGSDAQDHGPKRPGLLAEAALIELVRYIPSAEIDIERGENAGQRIVYTNIVTSWKTVGEWDGTAPLDMAKYLAHRVI